MKKRLIKVLLAIAVALSLLIAVNLLANAATEGIYTYFVSGGKVTISDCDASASGDIVIPSTIAGYPVVKIASSAFENCSLLTSIKIPDTITSISWQTFDDCKSLTSITVDENNQNYLSVDGNLLSKDKTTFIKYAIGKTDEHYTIPDGVTNIDRYAFANCKSLTTVTIPDGVTSIDIYAFDACTSLKNVTIGDTVTRIGDRAFRSCPSLTSITIPESLTEMSSITLINCKSLTSINVDENNKYFSSIDGNLFNKDKTTLIKYAEGKKDTLYTIPDTVTSIESLAFYNSILLTSVTIPKSITKISNEAFGNCPSLTSIEIPDSVTSIGSYAFEGCKSLTSVAIPDSVTNIGYNAFNKCSSLTNVYITDVAAWSRIIFENLDANPLNYAKKLYLNGVLVTDLVMPDSVTYIGEYVFTGTSLTSVTIPGSVKSIGDRAFYGCRSLTSVTIPDGVTSIGDYAFRDCTSLTSIPIPDSVTSIGNDAFRDCTSLTRVIIPDSVTSIGNGAFYGCTSLTRVIIPDSVTSMDNNAFAGCIALTSIKISDSIKIIDYAMFEGCTALTRITIPDGVTRIASKAFKGCSALKSIIIPESITDQIYNDSIEGCDSLKDVYYGGSASQWKKLMGYGQSAFATLTKHYFTGPADYTGIETAIAKVNALNRTRYTSKSLIKVDNAVTAVVYDLADVHQATVDAYAAGIEDALSKLELKSSGQTGAPITKDYSVTGTTRCTAAVDNATKKLNIVHSGVSTKTLYVILNVDTKGGETMTVSDVIGGEVTATGKQLYVKSSNSNVSFKVTITDADGAVTVFDAYANFGYPNFTFDGSMVAGVTRCNVAVDGTTINVVSNTGSKVSNMSFQFKLPEGATVAFAEGADTTYASFTSGAVLKVVNPGVGTLAIPMVLTDSEGIAMNVTLKANFMNAIKNRTNASVAQSGNNITLTGGSATMYAYFEKMGIDGAHIEVVNPSRNMLDRYEVLSAGMDVRFYHPTYNDGTVTINLLDANDEVVVSYNVTIKFKTKPYAPITAETLRAKYKVEGNTITLTANAGVSNVYMVIGKYWAEKLSVSGADETLVQRLTGVGWRIYRTDAPVEFDVIYDASAHGGRVATRHVVVNF